MLLANLNRAPDRAIVETADGFFPMEPSCETHFSWQDVTFEWKNGALWVNAASTAPKRFKLRWNGDASSVRRVLNDCWERAVNDIGWSYVRPDKPLPWYFIAMDDARCYGVGVKTGPNAFSFWQLDSHGVTLWLDVRCGTAGVQLTGPLLAAEVVTLVSEEGEAPYRFAQSFCSAMCEKPRLSKRPIFGSNNWYYAYGSVTRESVREDAKIMADIGGGHAYKPYMVIDDGWQTAYRTMAYNGGPWDACNSKFDSMAETAAQIEAEGCLPGIWFRPLLTEDYVLPEMRYARKAGIMPKAGLLLDPTHPGCLEKIAADTARIVGWGYKMLKHDFSSFDITGMNDNGGIDLVAGDDWTLYDRHLTTAQAVKGVYQTIQNAAGDTPVIACNCYNHLAAGIHEIMRSGGDTSGRVWEITRSDGVTTLGMRMYQHDRFFTVDADCPAFTESVPVDLNLRFAELIAMSGTALISSITPGLLTPAQTAELRRIYAIAAQPGNTVEPLDWMSTNSPSRYLYKGEEHCFDWYTAYDGVRTFYTWWG